MTEAAPGQLNVELMQSSGCRSVNCFHKLKMIGQGTYGKVFMAKDIQTGEIVALKKLRINNGSTGFPISAIREIQMLTKLKNHENIVQLKEIVTGNDGNKDTYDHDIYMVFEHMDHDLGGLLQQHGGNFSVPQIKCYMQQLLRALCYCHDNHVLHRDIKTANLLIGNNGTLKLADFGLARFMNTDNKLTNRVITQWYRPPELLMGSREYGPAVDMWSVGCIFAELLNHGEPILAGENEIDQLNKIFKLCGTPDEYSWPGVSKLPFYRNARPVIPLRREVRYAFKHFDRHALHLLEKMLTLNPSRRISAKDALDAEYFTTEPLPAAPNSLPKYESSHYFITKKTKRGQAQDGIAGTRQKTLQHLPRKQEHVISSTVILNPNNPKASVSSNQIPLDMDISPQPFIPVGATTSRHCNKGQRHGGFNKQANSYPVRNHNPGQCGEGDFNMFSYGIMGGAGAGGGDPQGGFYNGGTGGGGPQIVNTNTNPSTIGVVVPYGQPQDYYYRPPVPLPPTGAYMPRQGRGTGYPVLGAPQPCNMPNNGQSNGFTW